MDKLKHYGDMWIKFDNKNNPEYGFEVENLKIKKFYFLCSKEKQKNINKIILPTLNDKNIISNDFAMKAKETYMTSTEKWPLSMWELIKLQDYAKGSLKICSKCFEKLTKEPVKIYVPSDCNYSIMIDHYAFDDEIKPEFILKDDIDILRASRAFYSGFEYLKENWSLICPSKMAELEMNNATEAIGIHKYEEWEMPNFKITHIPNESEC